MKGKLSPALFFALLLAGIDLTTAWVRHRKPVVIHNLSLRVFVCLLALGFPLATQPVLAQKSIGVLTAKAALSCVKIKTPDAIGMGVAVGDGTLIGTCYHVIEGFKEVTIDSGLGKMQGTVIDTNPKQDLALIRIDNPLVPFRVSKSPDGPEYGSYSVQVGMDGEWREPEMNVGIVKTKFLTAFPNVVLTSIPKKGHSGGAVMNSNGDLIAITTGFCEYKDDHYVTHTGTEAIPTWKLWDMIQRIQKH